jgi:aryl-alcohol dehydrogenase-like predicted oxidoreductase
MISPGERHRIIFGCGNFGGLGSSPSLRDKGDDRDRALALLDQARDLGLTRFDTANTYGGGVSETVLGEWLRAQGPMVRSGFQIATKVGNPHGAPPGEGPLSRGEIARHLDQSLRRLGVERIDLYYIHEFDPLTPLDETLAALDLALAQGKFAAFGVSNATLDDLESVLSLAPEPLRRAFTHVQNEFNLLQQRDLKAVIPRAQAEGLAYVAFSPLAGGLLSGKYQEGRAPDPGSRAGAAPDMYQHHLTPETFAAVADLRAWASARAWSVPGAAVRFILETPGVDSLIIAPRSAEQFKAYAIG